MMLPCSFVTDLQILLRERGFTNEFTVMNKKLQFSKHSRIPLKSYVTKQLKSNLSNNCIHQLFIQGVFPPV